MTTNGTVNVPLSEKEDAQSPDSMSSPSATPNPAPFQHPMPDSSLGSLNPTNWSISRKWNFTALCCTITFLTGWNATALTATTALTNAHFHISDTTFPHSVWAVTAWNLGAALAPMIVLPIMEEHGTRPGYLTVYVLFFIFVIPQAITADYATFCGVRFLAGCCAGVLQTCMDGVVADVWRDGVAMSVPVSCYVGALLSGVSSGPVFGSVVTGGWGLGWRWVIYLQLIVYGAVFVPVLLVFRETRYAVVLAAAEARKEDQPAKQSSIHWHSKSVSLVTFLKGNVLRPFHLLFTEPVVFAFTLLSALSYGITFISTQSVAQVYSATYAFTEPHTGYIQASIVLGEIIGWLICVGVQDHFYALQCKKAEADVTGRLLRKLPEKRLYAAVPASFLALAAGLFVYGFTAKESISLYAPTAGLFLIGIGVVVVMQAIMMYVTDAYAKYAASASAAVCFGENIFAAFLPLGSQGMYESLGFGWASALLGFVALGLGVAPVVLVWKGEAVRRRSPFMREAIYA